MKIDLPSHFGAPTSPAPATKSLVAERSMEFFQLALYDMMNFRSFLILLLSDLRMP
jgi:hypothetical protein